MLPGDDGGDDSSDDEAVPKIVRVRLARRREDERDAKASRERRREEKAKAMKAKNGEERARTKQAPSGGYGRATNAGGEKRRFEKRPASFGDGGKKKKKPRHPDGRHALNAAATLAGKGRPRTKFD